MINWIHDLRSKRNFTLWFSVCVMSTGILGILLLILRALFGDTPGPSLFITFLYFTSQSNILVTLIVLLFLLGYSSKKWFKYIAFIGLLNIVITGVIFHILITPYMSNVTFTNHILHTVNPLLYLIFYYVIVTDFVELKKFWISLIYPLVYLSSVYIIIEPMFGNMLDRLLPDFAGARYVYPFLDPRLYDNQIYGLLLFNLGILAPLICILAFLLILLKTKIERSLKLNIKKTTQMRT
ncbi:MAG: hypothetical protein KKH92_08010 [Firmicutes bacterium]|nr:hypothetical protein [Bacillota bacterium]